MELALPIEKIAFVVMNNNINHKLVRECAGKALIESFINESRNGYKTSIGEKGIKLSREKRQQS